MQLLNKLPYAGSLKMGRKEENIVDSESPNDRQVYGYLGRIADEVVKIKQVLQQITSRESEIKAMLDEVTDIKENLVTRLTGMESIIKETSALAVTEAQQDQEIKERLAGERAALEAQLKEEEEILHTKDATIKELEKNLTDKIHDLEERIREKGVLLERRESVLKDLESTTNSLNTLAQDLLSLREDEIIALEAPQEGQETITGAVEMKEKEMKELQERMEAEIQGLRAKIREKDVILGAREMNIQMIKQTMGARIAELEKLTKYEEKGKKKASRLVSFLVDTGKKH